MKPDGSQNPKAIITLEVLAGAYSGRRPTREQMLFHSIDRKFDNGGEGVSLCGRIRADHLVDSNGMENVGIPPTCKPCLRRDPRFKKSVQRNPSSIVSD
jgi:hypothetical protein